MRKSHAPAQLNPRLQNLNSHKNILCKLEDTGYKQYNTVRPAICSQSGPKIIKQGRE